MSQRPLGEVISAAKALKAKAEQAEKQSRLMDEKSAQFKKKSGEHYVALGQKLAELKGRKPEGTTWPAFVKKHFGYSREWADELIRIAVGKTTVKATRAKAAKRKAKSRAKKSGVTNAGHTGSSDNVIHPSFGKDKPQAGDCDYDDGDPDHVDCDTPEQTRRQIFLNMAREWGIKRPTEVLDNAFFNKASPEEATDDLFVEIKKVIAAWNAIAAKLTTLKGASNVRVKVKA